MKPYVKRVKKPVVKQEVIKLPTYSRAVPVGTVVVTGALYPARQKARSKRGWTAAVP